MSGQKHIFDSTVTVSYEAHQKEKTKEKTYMCLWNDHSKKLFVLDVLPDMWGKILVKLNLIIVQHLTQFLNLLLHERSLKIL